MTEMKTLTIDGKTYEVVDETARTNISELTPADIGAAPAGFGLGPNYNGVLEDANLLDGNGFFRCNINMPDANWWYGIHLKYGTHFAYQMAWKVNYDGKTIVYEREKQDGIWGAWKTRLNAIGAAPAGYAEGTKQDGVKGAYFVSGAKGWYRVATTNQSRASCIFNLHHGYGSYGPSGLVCLIDAVGEQSGLQCIQYNGIISGGKWYDPAVSKVRTVTLNDGTVAIDVYYQTDGSNEWQISIIDTGVYFRGGATSQWNLQTPVFIAADDTLPDGETLRAVMEWQNPPMVLNEEYRTTERYLGKPVYAKLVDFGALPNATTKTVAHGIKNFLNGVSTQVRLSTGADATNWFGITSFLATASDASITTNGDQSAFSAIMKIKYTKNTD